ncbi:MAG TPA: MBL fold metallo-hydrolase [Candidatus Limnocylindria bacterium]|nr:MBL fold metallo-hydrolase [Candidatus Limnocylindria bacterium]
MKLEFCSLSSGSSGNATYVAAGGTRILVDSGLSARSVAAALAKINVAPETISAILVTHEHTDHVCGVRVLSRKYRIPIYANEATWEAMHRWVGDVAPGRRRVFLSESDFYVGDIGVLPMLISHDAAEPVAYRLYAGSHSAAVATDMGRVTKQVERHLAGSDLVLLESNHDPEMLKANARYSEALKRRIMGAHGHLSNLRCAETLMTLYGSGTRRALLGHLSQENNTPELAMHTVAEALTQQGLVPGRDIHLDMTWRDRLGGFYTIG